MECGIVVPTCLRTPVLILEPKECLCQYHKPELQGAFPTQFPIKGFGFVQPRNDLCRSIIPPYFRELPARVAAAMTTLIREDIQAADMANAEYHAPLRGYPRFSPPPRSRPAPHPVVTVVHPREPKAPTQRVLAAWMTSAWKR